MVQSSDRKSKGSVGIEAYQGRLRLRLPRSLYGGKQKYLSLGLDDTPGNRQIAEAKAKQIESDIVYERFDPSLAKYQPEHFKLVETKDETKTVPKLDELWSEFLKFKEKQCSPSTMYFQYSQFSRYLSKLPYKDLSDAVKARDWILENIPLESARRFIVRLNACCEWGIESKMIDSNPFYEMVKGIKKPKAESDEGFNDINPFTAEERDRILEAFKTNSLCSKYSRVKHFHYYPYVWFLFNTGCRPSEATALRWKDIEEDFSKIYFNRGAINSKQGVVEKKGLKTQSKRIFPCNGKVKEFLQSIKPEDCNPDDLLFPAPKGGFIVTNNFRSRIWEPVLNGLKLEYRKPYQTRHTFITLALDSGMNIKDVARISGNSPKVILDHYAGNKRDLFVPEF